MPIGYKYVSRSADSQLNWFEIGKNMTDMLAEVNRVREEKKAAYDQAAKDLENNLMEAPQGENQDVNDYTSYYSDLMIKTMGADVKAFKSGKLSEKEYALKMQNYMDGTKQTFDLSKLYQDEYKKKMDGVLSGELQAMNTFNMSMAEGYGDFNRSRPVIDPITGRVSIGLTETKIIDGKEVQVVSKNIAPVNIIRGKILHSVPTFDVDAKTTQTVKGFGTRKDTLYEHATLNNAGSITEYMGPAFLSTLKDPVDIKIVKDMNEAIDNQVSSYFSNPYNLSSVLTENLGKYNAESFTFDKDVADADPNKILVKIDPNTKMTTLDDKGKNYKSQEKEAADWVKSDILRKMDEERSIKTTPQNQLQERRPKDQTTIDDETKKANERTLAKNLAFLITGTDQQSNNSLKYLAGQGIIATKKGNIITVQTANGDVDFDLNKTKPRELMINIIGAANPNNLNQDRVVKYGQGYVGTKAMNLLSKGSGITPKQKPLKPVEVFSTYIDQSSAEFDSKDKYKTSDNLNDSFAGTGFTFKASIRPYNDVVYITNEQGVESPPFKALDKKSLASMKKWMKGNMSAKNEAGVLNKDAYATELIQSGLIGGGAEVDYGTK